MRPKIGIALSGGAARGLAHIGVLKVLERESVPLDMIAGTSSGAIVAAMYAAGMGAKDIEAIARDLKWMDLIAPTWPKDGLLSGQRLSTFVRERIPVSSFSRLKVPLAIPAVDILSRRIYIFRKGRLDTAIQASCAVPGIFRPVRYRGMLLVDGGVLENLPSKTVREIGADLVLGVDVNRRGRLFDRVDNLFKILLQCQYIMMEATTRELRNLCDYLVEPDVGKGGFLSLERVEDFIEAGERAAIPVVKKLKRRLEGCTR